MNSGLGSENTSSCKWPIALYQCSTVNGRSHFISRLSMIVRVNVVLNRTVVGSDWHFDITCAVVIFRVKVVSRQLMVLKSGYWSVLSIKSRCYWSSQFNKPWCYWLWRLVMSLVRFDPCIMSQLKSPLLLVQLSVVRSFSRRWFCVSPSISLLYCAGNCWLRFSGVCSKL